jgi:hypothetical protein
MPREGQQRKARRHEDLERMARPHQEHMFFEVVRSGWGHAQEIIRCL